MAGSCVFPNNTCERDPTRQNCRCMMGIPPEQVAARVRSWVAARAVLPAAVSDVRGDGVRMPMGPFLPLEAPVGGLLGAGFAYSSMAGRELRR